MNYKINDDSSEAACSNMLNDLSIGSDDYTNLLHWNNMNN